MATNRSEEESLRAFANIAARDAKSKAEQVLSQAVLTEEDELRAAYFKSPQYAYADSLAVSALEAVLSIIQEYKNALPINKLWLISHVVKSAVEAVGEMPGRDGFRSPETQAILKTLNLRVTRSNIEPPSDATDHMDSGPVNSELIGSP